MQALRFGTAAAAELLGIGEELGTLEPGKKADLVAVTDNPLQDMDALRDVRLVLRNGVKVWPANEVEA
jgi:imidazolonepropionase-like amidohydrolase